MGDTVDLLYIAFTDLQETASSGSSVRPQKMLQAFQALGLQIKVLDGWNNQRRKRKRRVREVLRWLKANRPRMCYVEPPSGPFFCSIDLWLLIRLHHMGVPIGLFYRDAYWKFPEFDLTPDKRLLRRMKVWLIKQMHRRDWWVFQHVLSCTFFPSETMASYFTASKAVPLPPACDPREHETESDMVQRIATAECLTYIYVGGATTRYGAKLLLEAFEKVNRGKMTAKLIFICPKEQWDAFCAQTEICREFKWLEVVSAFGDEALAKLYARADIAVFTPPRTVYSDFAIPVKSFEYLSYWKPILTTDCVEMEQFVKANDIGWIVHDNSNALAEQLLMLQTNRQEVIEKKQNCPRAEQRNTWAVRAQTVLEILEQ